jgi:AcrR family transcriptional regulator
MGTEPLTPRERARAQTIRDVVAAANTRLSTEGAAALSLRAVARDVGMVSSAVYRYVPSRDALLTLLLIQGYDALGESVEAADRAARRRTAPRRWLAVCRATREWALAQPQVWALLFGSPVPGYAAPRDTVGPATRLPRVLIGQLVAAHRGGGTDPALDHAPPPRARALIAPLREHLLPEVLPDEALIRALIGWTHLVGAISFELFGHRVGSVTDDAAYFDEEMTRIGAFTGLR